MSRICVCVRCVWNVRVCCVRACASIVYVLSMRDVWCDVVWFALCVCVDVGVGVKCCVVFCFLAHVC